MWNALVCTCMFWESSGHSLTEFWKTYVYSVSSSLLNHFMRHLVLKNHIFTVFICPCWTCLNHNGGVMVSVFVWKTMKLVVFDFLLITRHEGGRANTGWPEIGILCASGATSLSVDCCFSKDPTKRVDLVQSGHYNHLMEM